MSRLLGEECAGKEHCSAFPKAVVQTIVIVSPFYRDKIDAWWQGFGFRFGSSPCTLPIEKVAEGYRAMDERRAIKTLLSL